MLNTGEKKINDPRLEPSKITWIFLLKKQTNKKGR